MSRNYLFLDLDGTLIDSLPGIHRAFSESALRLGLPVPSENDLSPLLGPPVDQILACLYPELCNRVTSSFVSLFREKYDLQYYSEFQLYPGVHRSLHQLHSCGYLLSIVTNKPTHVSRVVLGQASLLDLFSGVYGVDYPVVIGSSPNTFRSKSEALSFALSDRQARSRNPIYIGDTPGDMKAAASNNIPFAICEYGYYRWPPSVESAAFRLTSFDQILSLL
ncbi:HAD family hydrolase [Synechococcus sp. W4D4]|uniref:HAD family hydrolase n=1 Tax=Synechococcus sp. W4D4 TaxID=3392294 RepID=UPI0039EA0C49